MTSTTATEMVDSAAPATAPAPAPAPAPAAVPAAATTSTAGGGSATQSSNTISGDVAQLPPRKRRNSSFFVLSGTCNDVERRWARLRPVVLNAGGRAYPRVFCFGLNRMFLPESLVNAIFHFPDPDRAADDMRDAAKYPEVTLLDSNARDTQTLRELGTVTPEECEYKVLIMTVRGVVSAVREIKDRQLAIDPTWERTLQNAWCTLAMIQKLFTSEPRPTEPEDMYVVQQKPMLETVELYQMPQVTQPGDVIPQLRPRRRGKAKTPTTELAAQTKALRAELKRLEQTADELRGDIMRMRAILVKL